MFASLIYTSIVVITVRLLVLFGSIHLITKRNLRAKYGILQQSSRFVKYFVCEYPKTYAQKYFLVAILR